MLYCKFTVTFTAWFEKTTVRQTTRCFLLQWAYWQWFVTAIQGLSQVNWSVFSLQVALTLSLDNLIWMSENSSLIAKLSLSNKQKRTSLSMTDSLLDCTAVYSKTSSRATAHLPSSLFTSPLPSVGVPVGLSPLAALCTLLMWNCLTWETQQACIKHAIQFLGPYF